MISLSIHAPGQNITADLFQQPANTDANMTIAMNASNLNQYEEVNAYPLWEQSFSYCEQNQWLLPFDGNTGSNMTILLQESFINSLNIQTGNAYIVATTETGLVIGSSYANTTQTSLVIWGNDSFTSEIDGAIDGQVINLHLIDSN